MPIPKHNEGEKEHKQESWKNISFVIPISEAIIPAITENAAVTNNDTLVIEGIAINATTTLNGHKFVAHELEKSAGTLANKPLLKDHNNSVDSIVGRVTTSSFDSVAQNVKFRANILDESCKKKIKQGLISSVSVGASCDDLEESTIEGEEGVLIVKGITFNELSLVAVPADPNAGFAMALSESLKMREDLMDEKQNSEKTVEKVVEQTKSVDVTAELQKRFEELVKQVEELKKKETKTEVKDETKGVVTQQSVDENMIVEHCDKGKGFMLMSKEYDKRFKSYAR